MLHDAEVSLSYSLLAACFLVTAARQPIACIPTSCPSCVAASPCRSKKRKNFESTDGADMHSGHSNSPMRGVLTLCIGHVLINSMPLLSRRADSAVLS
jgi:hypothetical protein